MFRRMKCFVGFFAKLFAKAYNSDS
ncbi:protein of unknown function [Burkholderia multivorans]